MSARRMMSHRRPGTGDRPPGPPDRLTRTAGPGVCARTRRRRSTVPDASPQQRARVTRSRGGGGRNLDLAVDDLLTEGVDVVLDVIDEAAGGGQAHALGGEVVDDVRAALG